MNGWCCTDGEAAGVTRSKPCKISHEPLGVGGLLYIWSCEHKLSWLVKANRSGSDVQWGWSWTWARQREMEIIGWWLERIIQNPIFMQLDTNLSLHIYQSQIMRLVYVQLITGAKNWLHISYIRVYVCYGHLWPQKPQPLAHQMFTMSSRSAYCWLKERLALKRWDLGDQKDP